MSTAYDFDEMREWSKEHRQQESDIGTLRAMFPAAVSVTKTGVTEDRAGTDYIVELRRGARLRVDAKARRPGCRRFWKAGPEVALEVWSVKPGGKYGTASGRTGWALDEAKEIDLILFTFDRADHQFAYVRALPLLRETFRRNYGGWHVQFRTETQDSLAWESECVFVPLLVLDQAMEAASRAARME